MPNVQDLITQDRDFIRRRGDYLNQQAQDLANQSRANYGAYQSYADEVYDPLIGGRGGYNQREVDAIYGNPGRYMATGQDFENNYLTPEEINDIRGNPWSRAAYFDPESDMARQYESSNRQRGAVDQLGRDMGAAITPDLALDSDYRNQQMGSISGTAAAVRNAVDPTRLRADQGALDDIRMSPDEYNRAITGASRAAGVGFRSAVNDTERRALASGMNPMGVAAMRGRMERESAVARGNAATNAQIQAGSQRAARAGQAEGFRMRGEESAADRTTGAQLAAGQFETGARSNLENQRLGAAQDVSGRRMTAAATTGQARVGTEADAANRETASRNFNTTLGTNLATGIEQDSSARAAGVAQNRQQTGVANQGTRFNQGMAATLQQGQAAQTVGGARRQDSAEGRAYLNSQLDRQNSNEQANYNRQAGLYGTQGALQLGTTQAQVAQNARPRWWEQVLGAGSGVAGAYLAGR